jgi:SAM-dependent methyltransferase
MLRSHPKPDSPDVGAINRTFYDALWKSARLERPDAFNTWPLVSEFLPAAPARLEIGPGLRPRLPIAGTHFVDTCEQVIECLTARGGLARSCEANDLAFADAAFDLVCAFDVIEHVPDDRRVFAEMSRVLKDGGVLICSMPLHASQWTEFDDWVGHARRYDPVELVAMMAANELQVERSGAFGMQPANPRLVKYGMWWLEQRREWAMFWYNWVGLPLAMKFQKRLKLVPGLIDTRAVDEAVFVCRRAVR